MEDEEKKEEEKKDRITIFYALSLAWQLGFLIAVPIGGFLIFGYWLDSMFKTSPLFIFIGLIVGILVTIYEVNHLLSPLIKRGKNDKH